ncbi:radical SAM protein [Deinococcus sp. HMF7604]|uniref:radical SAM protein n=1 Tax=Deinococcus betulae TaxID=2873312 RepID=UPI001CC92833|nr:radical SAM protein [Deinococcus betulae]MBZ9751956.1 radical SAM protein [Deinococcus betulae]
MLPAWRFRSEGGQLTAFCTATGARLSSGLTPTRLRAPELLDVKLTDVCSVGCAFCYQDSRPDRRHAQLEDVAQIAAEAGRAGVFEVALGGGEVSEYPDFLAVLHLFRGAGVVPNFTTRRMRWLAQLWPQVRGLVGGVAVSVGRAAEVRLLGSLIPASERLSGQLVAQVVMGTVQREELRSLVWEAGAAGIRVTLLGFKDVGRGQTFQPLPYTWWLADLADYVRHTPVSIDTALAAECPADLAALLVPGSYHTEEGRFSAYVDAVAMTLAPSSYHAGPVHPFRADWLQHFASPGFVQGPVTPPARGRVRLGFATNSSSSHSLVLLREPVADDPADPAEWEEAFATKYGEFTAASLEAKRYYLAAVLMMAQEHLFPRQTEAEAQALIRRLCDLPEGAPLSAEGIDHQSALWFKPNPAGAGPHPHQFERVKTVLLAPPTSIFGRSDMGGDEDALRWQQVDFMLDSADFMYMLSLDEAEQPLPPRTPALSEPLYLLGLVRGQRFLAVVQRALAAGLSWAEVKAALLEGGEDDEEQEPDHPALFLKVLAAAGLHPPAFLLAQPDRDRATGGGQWFSLYLKAPPEDLDRFMARLERLWAEAPAFSHTVLDYATSDLGFSRFDRDQFGKLLKALERGGRFVTAVGPEQFGIFLRITDYLKRL